jgi:hypothetical protein
MLRLKKFDTTFVVVYHLCLLAFAYFTYSRLDFKENFEMPENTSVNRTTIFYFTIATHSTSGSNIQPKTTLSRRLVSLHMALSMIPLLLIFA